MLAKFQKEYTIEENKPLTFICNNLATMNFNKIVNNNLYLVVVFGIFSSDQITNGDLNKMSEINRLISQNLQYSIQKRTRHGDCGIIVSWLLSCHRIWVFVSGGL
jgi:hypothetical protein